MIGIVIAGLAEDKHLFLSGLAIIRGERECFSYNGSSVCSYTSQEAFLLLFLAAV